RGYMRTLILFNKKKLDKTNKPKQFGKRMSKIGIPGVTNITLGRHSISIELSEIYPIKPVG
ncbi:MAG: hypothetical protein KAW88_06075, partial [Candidatus Cloacimonetes bacterium]|nr:hypothetical protein [Candidatus Cloacimonadota bacterium]